MGFEINFKDNQLVNLTSMWKAAGMVHGKKPYFWLRNGSTKELIEQIQRETKSHDLVTLYAGRNGGTFAHWKLGLSYAAFLNPKIHSWYMDVVKERFKEMADPDHSGSTARCMLVSGIEFGGFGDRQSCKLGSFIALFHTAHVSFCA
jgi:hypothetical protein